MNPLEEAVQKSLGTLPPLKVDVIESTLDSNLTEEIQEWLNKHSNDTLLFMSQVPTGTPRFITTTFIYREG